MEKCSKITDAYELICPSKQISSVVFASPHSGRLYSEDFLKQSILTHPLIRSSEDAYVDLLIRDVVDRGVYVLLAQHPRAYLDLNRAADEMDAAVVEGAQPNGQNPRLASGLGVIPRVVAHGRPIYHGKLSQREAQDRIDKVWSPYHATLTDLLNETHRSLGESILIDMHSMPHDAVAAFNPSFSAPDIVLGDRYGASASSYVVDRVSEALKRHGLSVVRNSPFAGAYICQKYGRPSQNQHAIQIEINRSLYLDEASVDLKPDWQVFQRVLQNALKDIAEIGSDGRSLAAE